MHFLLPRKNIQPLLFFVQIADIRILCIHVADQYQHTIQCMNTKNTYFILEKSAHIYFWLRWKLGLLFRKRNKKYLQMVNCRSMDYTLLSSYSKQGDDLTNCFSYKKRVCNATVLDWDMLCALLYKQKMGAIVHVIVWVGILQ